MQLLLNYCSYLSFFFPLAASEVIREVLYNVISQDVNVSRKLGYLNGLVKMCMKKQMDFGIPYRDIFCW